MNFVKFTHESLSIGDITDLVNSECCGATSVFIGSTRDSFDGKLVVRLEYEAYESMGIKAMEKICHEIREKWADVKNIAIYHRLGIVPVKEASIVIAIASPHRSDAIQATEYCINNVKKSVTIWKKEVYAESKPEWKENKEYQSCAPKLKKMKLSCEPKVEVPFVPPHLVQIKASNSDIQKRIENFMERKREEINIRNIRQFCTTDRPSEFTCARVDVILQKTKNSKGHLQVNRVHNTYYRDQTNSDYLSKFLPTNGVEERFQNLETQLSLTTPISKNIYQRLKVLEDRMLYLESISPEYLNFWDKTNLSNKFVKKKIFSLEEIDSFITDLEKKNVDDKNKMN